MFMLSKKELSSEELETLRRSRTPTVVVTVSGEVLTNEEAQVCGHDLGLFVTVQLVEEMPAVLSLGKLCEDHGFSYEWVSGQEPRLTNRGENFFFCKTDNFVPVVDPGFVIEFWYQFVFYIVTAGLNEYIFKSSNRAM